MPSQQTQADRMAVLLRRLGLALHRTGRSFRIVDGKGACVGGPMGLAEIERWIGEFIKPKTA
jgi:hypothetical protein